MDALHRQHAQAALAAAAVVLLAHAWLLAGAPPGPGPVSGPARLEALQVRQIVQAAQTAQAAPVQAPPAPVPRRPVHEAAVPEPMPAELPAPSAVGPDAVPARDAEPPQAPVPAGVEVPRYTTQLPPPLLLHFSTRRGALVGQAELRWQHDGARYELSLRSRFAGVPTLAHASQGQLDADGIAPERYAEVRRGRELRAVNFQRDSGRITFSGPSTEHALVAGAQDRLSWMLQLPSVLAANPELAQAGRQVQLFVAGPRGDAELWTFLVQGAETLELPSGATPALRLHREPRRPYDQEVDLWLDARRPHLPLRARLQARGGGAPLEFTRERVAAP